MPEYTSMSTDGVRRRWPSSGRAVAPFRINTKESKISEVASRHTADDDNDSLLSPRTLLYVSWSVLTLGFYGPHRLIFRRTLTGLSPPFLHTYILLYRVIQNDCRGFNNLSYTIHLRQDYMYFLFNRTTLQVCYVPYRCSTYAPFVILHDNRVRSKLFLACQR